MPKNSSLYGLSEEQVAALTELAATLGYKVSRGPGAGERGNMAKLMAAIADAYIADVWDTTHYIGGLALKRVYSQPDKYRSPLTMDPPRDVYAELDALKAQVEQLETR